MPAPLCLSEFAPPYQSVHEASVVTEHVPATCGLSMSARLAGMSQRVAGRVCLSRNHMRFYRSKKLCSRAFQLHCVVPITETFFWTT